MRDIKLCITLKMDYKILIKLESKSWKFREGKKRKKRYRKNQKISQNDKKNGKIHCFHLI